MTDIHFDAIRERDMDTVIMREFYTNRLFADLFLKQVGIEECDTISIGHSVMDAALGESDIEIILESNGKKIALLIENKINADEQPKQYERYTERGDKKKSEGAVDAYCVFMTAPTIYFASHNQYPYRVNYEEMLDVMADDFSRATIKKALEKKAYTPFTDEMVSAFWTALYDYVEKNQLAPQIDFLTPRKQEKGKDKERGTNAQWPGFKTDIDGMLIQWKAGGKKDKDFVDLQLNDMADYQSQIKNLLEETLGNHTYQVVKTGKSSSIRKVVPHVDFHKSFDEQKERVAEALRAVRELHGLAQEIGEDVQRIRENEPSPLLKKAIAIATEAHKGQKDKAGSDYIGHPLRVAARVEHDNEKIVAVLHDTIEDSFVTADYLREQGFPQEIVDGVLSVTRQEGESYDDFVHRAARNPLGRAVKMADLEDNMDIRRLNYPMNEWDFERLNKYLKSYKYLKQIL